MAVFSRYRMVTDGLVLYIDSANKKSYPGSGAVWDDLSGSRKIVTCLGPTPTWSDNIFTMNGSSQYFRYNQIDSRYITFSTYLYLEEYPTALEYYSIVRQGYNPVNYCVNINNSNYEFKIYCYGQSSGVNLGTGIYAELNTWFYITTTWDWITKEVKLYLNGSYLTTLDISAAGDYLFNNSQSYNYADICRNVTNNNGFIKGKVSNYTIYNRVLTQPQIEQNFNVLRGRFGL